MRSSLKWLGVGLFTACGAATPVDHGMEVKAPEAPSNEPSADESSAASASTDAAESSASSPAQKEPALAVPVPDACDAARGEDECVPPTPWVTKLCNGVYAEVALVMFRGGSPWQRLYVRGKTRAVNASGGATVEGFLMRDEEVLVLRHRKADSSGMQIGDGSGQYDALRWNGSCVSLEGGEVTSRRPRAPGQARIEWSWLGQGMRSALRQDEALSQAYQARQKECRGATTGTVSKACERLDLKLIDRIAHYVRSGPELPAPEEHP